MDPLRSRSRCPRPAVDWMPGLRRLCQLHPSCRVGREGLQRIDACCVGLPLRAGMDQPHRVAHLTASLDGGTMWRVVDTASGAASDAHHAVGCELLKSQGECVRGGANQGWTLAYTFAALAWTTLWQFRGAKHAWQG